MSGTVDGTPSDLNLHTGEVTELGPPEASSELLDAAFETARQERSRVEPNPFCVTCRRVATCGAYPSGRRVLPVNCVTVALTKTDLSRLGRCERRVAWSRFHQIPRADRGEDSASIRRGIVFHDLITQAVDGDPSAVLDGVLHLIPAEERADFESMFTTHLALLESERLTIRKPKVWAGSTFLHGEPHEMRAATVLGEIDLTADDGDGLALVEIKTGAVTSDQSEADLYAVGVAAWFRGRGRKVPRLTVHRHFVRPPDGECMATP